jgi:cysteine/O-acetylserine efflux protein
METGFLAGLSFALITIFTPGPNNISSASMGVLYGYRKTTKFLLGIVLGFFILMFGIAMISTALLEAFPSLERVLGILGAIYILYLAYGTFHASYTFEEGDQVLLGFFNGVLLQFVNPKAIIFGLTMYSTFLAPMKDQPILLLLSVLGLAAITFSATSTWALFGAAIRTQLREEKVRRLVNLGLSLLLVYTALEISGLL